MAEEDTTDKKSSNASTENSSNSGDPSVSDNSANADNSTKESKSNNNAENNNTTATTSDGTKDASKNEESTLNKEPNSGDAENNNKDDLDVNKKSNLSVGDSKTTSNEQSSTGADSTKPSDSANTFSSSNQASNAQHSAEVSNAMSNDMTLQAKASLQNSIVQTLSMQQEFVSVTQNSITTSVAAISYSTISAIQNTSRNISVAPVIPVDIVPIFIAPVHYNSAPVNNIPIDIQFVNQDANLIFDLAHKNLISVVDYDDGGAAEIVTLTVIGGAITVHNTIDVGVNVEGNISSKVILTGTLPAINVVLDGLEFAPSADFSGITKMQISTDDLGHTGLGGAKISTSEITIGQSAGGISLSNQNINLGTQHPFFLSGTNSIIISDHSAAPSIYVKLVAANGTIHFSGNVNGYPIIVGDNSSVILIQDTIAAINNDLQTLIFTPYSNFSGATTIKITINDLPGGVDGIYSTANVSQTLNLNVNDATIALSAPNESLNMNANVLSVGNTNVINQFALTGSNLVQVGDIGISSTSVMTVQLTANHGAIDFNGSVSSAHVTSGANNTITITDTVSNINNALKLLTFTPVVGFNGVGSISVLANDLSNTSINDASSYSKTLIVNVNDAAVSLATTNNSVNIDANILTGNVNVFNTFALTGANLIQVSDPEAIGDLITVQLTATHGTIGFSDTIAGATITSGAHNTITLTDTVDNVNNALKLLTFTSDLGFNGAATITVLSNNLPGVLTPDNSTDPSNYSRILTINVNDATLSITPVGNSINIDSNVAVDGTSHTVNTILLVDSSSNGLIQVSDTSPSNYPTTIQLTAHDGTLGFASSTIPAVALTGTLANGNTVVTMTGTIAQLNAALATVNFTANAGFNGAASIDIAANNSPTTAITDLSSYKQTLTLHVNDATLSITPVGNSINIDSNVAVDGTSHTVNTILLVDSSSNGLIQVSDTSPSNYPTTIQLTAHDGTLGFASGTIPAIAANGTLSSNNTIVTMTGTIAELNAALATVNFTANAGFNGAASIDVAANNSPTTAITDLSSYKQTLTLHVNDATLSITPVGNSINIDSNVAVDGTNYTVNTVLLVDSSNNGLIQVSDTSPSDYPTTIQLTAHDGTLGFASGTIPAVASNGTLSSNNTIVTITGTIAQLNAALATVNFTANAGFNGAASIDVAANNSPTTAITDLSSYKQTLTLHVNDATLSITPVGNSINIDSRLCRALGDNVEHPCSTKALAKRDMLIAGLGHLPRLKFAALSKVSA